MKSGYFMLAALVMTVFLNGCTNRFETYEPYSTFDDRMAAADKSRPYPPDDQMPSQTDDQYASASDQEKSSNDYQMDDEPTRVASKGGFSSGQSDEVPFSSSRNNKRPMNIGAY